MGQDGLDSVSHPGAVVTAARWLQWAAEPAPSPSTGSAKLTTGCVKVTQGRAEAPGGGELTSCIYPLAEDFYPSAGAWDHARIPWCRSRFPFLSGDVRAANPPWPCWRLSLGLLPKKRREDRGCLCSWSELQPSLSVGRLLESLHGTWGWWKSKGDGGEPE